MSLACLSDDGRQLWIRLPVVALRSVVLERLESPGDALRVGMALECAPHEACH